MALYQSSLPTLGMEEHMLYCCTFQNIIGFKISKICEVFCPSLYLIKFLNLILKYFPFSTSKPSSDLLDLQPDFSGGAAAAAAPAPPPPSGGTTAWGGESNQRAMPFFLFSWLFSGYNYYTLPSGCPKLC